MRNSQLTLFISLAGLLLSCGGISVSADEDVATQVCEPGPAAYRCNGLDVEKCSDDGTAFLFVTQCNTEETCNGGNCQPKTGAPTCTDGEFRCSVDQGVLQMCKGGQGWGVVEPCENGCQDGACVVSGAGTGSASGGGTSGTATGNECNAGDRRCTDDGKTQLCKPGMNGQPAAWSPPTSCPPDMSCYEGECTSHEEIP